MMDKIVMDKISDELRKWCESENGTGCGGFVTGYSSEKLCDLADRIDAEMVELPKDADGVPIHVGDTLDGYGKTIEVVEMRYGRCGWVLISRDGSGYADTFAFAHRHAPTVEDVLREFAEKYRFSDTECTYEEAITEYAAKLRLAGDGGEQ